MKKKIFFIIIVFVFVFAIGDVLYHTTYVANRETNEEDYATVMKQESAVQENNVDEMAPDNVIVEIPIENVKGITQQEAEKLCYSVLGEKDEENGFTFSFATSGAVEKDAKQYYVIRASWLVDNSHLSYIGDFFVSSDGKELYSGMALAGEYEMSSKIWSEQSDE